MKAGVLKMWWENYAPSGLKEEDAEEKTLSPVYSMVMQGDALWGLSGTGVSDNSINLVLNNVPFIQTRSLISDLTSSRYTGHCHFAAATSWVDKIELRSMQNRQHVVARFTTMPIYRVPNSALTDRYLMGTRAP